MAAAQQKLVDNDKPRLDTARAWNEQKCLDQEKKVADNRIKGQRGARCPEARGSPESGSSEDGASGKSRKLTSGAGIDLYQVHDKDVKRREGPKAGPSMRKVSTSRKLLGVQN